MLATSEPKPVGPAGGFGSTAAPPIDCRAVSSGYLGKAVLNDVTFRIDAPGIYVVLGPNGAGKTTLLRTLAGILRPLAGDVLVEGHSVLGSDAGDRLHYLSHVEGIPDDLKVREALAFYALVEGASDADVERVLDQLEIRALANSFLSQLSAGQRKRVSIARIFLRERQIYLLDEPTSNLDPKVAAEIRSLILRLSQDKVVLYSSHNLFEAREIGRYVIAIRAGRLALFDRIDHLRTARYVVGLRALEPSEALAAFERQGDYFLRELPGPEAVPQLIRDLEARGVLLREVREMGNPLQDLFD